LDVPGRGGADGPGCPDGSREAGADLVYRELEDLSHTYPREENDRILAWFDPSLARPRV
jgi:hypothetical protein